MILYTLLTGELPFKVTTSSEDDYESLKAKAKWNRPPWFSRSLTETFEKIFVVDVDRRATLADVQRMEWWRTQCSLGGMQADSAAPTHAIGDIEAIHDSVISEPDEMRYLAYDEHNSKWNIPERQQSCTAAYRSPKPLPCYSF